MTFHILCGIDAVIALVAVYFFFAGLADGSVSSFNIGLWTALLLALGGILGGGIWLNSAGHRTAASLLLLVLAAPGILATLFFLIVLLSKPRWN